VSALAGLARPPAAAFRVGITGARKLDAQACTALRASLAGVLGRIQTLVATHAGAPRGAGIYAEGAPLLRLLSPLAEGADRLAAEAGLALGYRLEALLPFPAEEYERDFPDSVPAFRALLAQAGSCALALDGARGDEETRSYEAAGRMVARNCDLLIAIWDGGKSRGRGGTAAIVRFAARHGQPVWWLRADGAGAPCWIDHGRTLDRLESAPSGADAWARLQDYVEAAICPPPAPAGQDPLMGYLAEATPKPQPLWSVYHWVLRWAAGPKRAAAPAPALIVPPGKLWPYWQAAFDAPDQLAVAYGNRYRSSYVLVFALAALALTFSTFGAEQIAPTALELLCLGCIFLIVRLNVSQHWHERFVTYRLLAELCRKQQALAMFGWSLPVTAATEIASQAAVAREAGGTRAKPPRDRWVAWYFNAMARAAPLPQGIFTGDALGTAMQAVQSSLVRGQESYHAWRRQVSEAAGRRFGGVGRLFFLATLLIVLLKLILVVAHAVQGRTEAAWFVPAIGDARLLFGALPGVTGFLIGVKSYAEWDLLASQSAHMQRLMALAEVELAGLDMTAPLASQDAGAAILPLTENMLLDIKGWAQLIRVKAVEPG
jgi:hypothetical protein